MKKLFLLASAALVLAACSQNDVSETIDQAALTSSDNAIQFGTYVNQSKQTRAEINDLTTLQSKGFHVFAYYTQKADYTSGSFAPNALWNRDVTYSSSTWSYSPVIYWPNNVDDEMSFFAYAIDATSGTDYTVAPTDGSTNGDPKITLSAPGLDLLYATPQKNLKHNDNGGQDVDHSITDKVTFTFQHAAAKITLYVRHYVDEVRSGSSNGSKDLESGTTVTLTSVKFIPTSGSSYATSGATFNLATPGWEGITGLTETQTWWSGTQNVTKSATAVTDGSFTIIPETSGTINGKIEVTYTVKTTGTDGGSTDFEVTNDITMNTAQDIAAVYGKNTNIYLDLGLTSVKFDAAITAWGDNTDQDVDLPANNE